MHGWDDPRVPIFSRNFLIYRRERLFVPVKRLRDANARRAGSCAVSPGAE